MFGRINLLTDGAQTEGLVTKASYMDPGFNKKLMVHVRVKFPDGSEREFLDSGLWVSDVGLLLEGSVVPVRYDPSKHSRLTIDRPALKEKYAPVKARKEAEREHLLEAKFEQLGTSKAEDNASSGASSGRSIRARVTYREVVSGETKTTTIVSVASVFDRREGEATDNSPKGKALLGRAAGDRVMLPQGLNEPPIEVEIVAIDESGA